MKRQANGLDLDGAMADDPPPPPRLFFLGAGKFYMTRCYIRGKAISPSLICWVEVKLVRPAIFLVPVLGGRVWGLVAGSP